MPQGHGGRRVPQPERDRLWVRLYLPPPEGEGMTGREITELQRHDGTGPVWDVLPDSVCDAVRKRAGSCHKKWTRYKLLCAVHDIWDELGRTPTSREAYAHRLGPRSHGPYTRLFGSWRATVEVARDER